MKNIANLVNINLRSYERQRSNSIIELAYLVRTAKILSNYIIIIYLINFPLFTHCGGIGRGWSGGMGMDIRKVSTTGRERGSWYFGDIWYMVLGSRRLGW